MGASSRYRTYQYLDYLKQQGFKTDVSPLLGDEYLKRLYNGQKSSKFYFLKTFMNRFFEIFKTKNYDLLVVEKELFPYIPPLLEHLLKIMNPNIIVDYDDAIFANYQNKFLLKGKIPTVIGLSKAVNVGNRCLADYARKFNRNMNLIPTGVDIRRYRTKENYEIKNGKIVIGWIGTPMTTRYLFEIQEVLSKLSQKCPIILRCIGTPSDFVMNGINIENVRWNESTEIKGLLTFDIGIMPLTNDPFSRGKCGLKLIQYMACGIPSVASPIGANKDIIQDGVNGFLANAADDWIHKFSLLIEDQKLREKIGKEGRKTVEEKYTLQVIAPKLLEIYKENARKNS